MNKHTWLLIFICLVGLSSGTAVGDNPYNLDDPNNSLVFGYIDMSDAPTKVQEAWLQQISPSIEKPYRPMSVEDGVFYHVFIPPGTYQISSFGGSGFMAGEHVYNFGRQGRNETAVEIKQPGIYFLGAYKYVKVAKGGMFKQRKFSIDRIADPTEAELLKIILDDVMGLAKAKGYKGPRKIKISETVWADKIRARLKELQ